MGRAGVVIGMDVQDGGDGDFGVAMRRYDNETDDHRFQLAPE